MVKRRVAVLTPLPMSRFPHGVSEASTKSGTPEKNLRENAARYQTDRKSNSCQATECNHLAQLSESKGTRPGHVHVCVVDRTVRLPSKESRKLGACGERITLRYGYHAFNKVILLKWCFTVVLLSGFSIRAELPKACQRRIAFGSMQVF